MCSRCVNMVDSMMHSEEELITVANDGVKDALWTKYELVGTTNEELGSYVQYLHRRFCL